MKANVYFTLASLLLSTFFCTAAELEHGGVRVVVDPETGQPVTIEDGRTGIVHLDLATSFALRFPRTGTDEWVNMDSFEMAAHTTTATGFRTTYVPLESAPEGLIIHTSMALSEDGELHFSCEIENDSSLPVLAVRYPILHNLSLEGHGEESAFIPVQTGLFVAEPRLTAMTWIDHYPRYCMGWSDYFTPKGGLMLLTQNPDLTMHEIAMQTRQGLMTMWMALKNSTLPGETQMYRNSVIPHAGDWRTAAARYRGHFDSAFPKSYEFPEWVRRSNGYLSFSYQGPNPPAYEGEYKNLLDNTWHLGMQHVQLWGQTGHSACPAYLWPSPQRGGEEAYAGLVRSLRASGLHVGNYFLSTSVSAFHAQADSWPGVDDKSSIPENIRPKFQEFNPYHERYGDGTEGGVRRQFLSEMLQRYNQEIDKSFLILTEGALDAYNDRAGALISNFSRPLGPRSYWPSVAYQTVFPNALLYEGHANGHWNFPQNAISVAHAFLNGNRFDLMHTFAMYHEVQEMVWLRESLTDFLQDTDFTAVESNALPEGIEARMWSKDYATLMTVYNPELLTEREITFSPAWKGMGNRPVAPGFRHHRNALYT